MNATSTLRPSASSPWFVAEPSAMTSPDFDPLPPLHDGLLVDARTLVGASKLRQLVDVFVARVSLDDDSLGSDRPRRAGRCATTNAPESTAALYSMPVPTSGASVRSSGTACRCMLAPISARMRRRSQGTE